MLNFKKGGLFSRKNDPEITDTELDKGTQVLAVWGSPGCGKTTVAVKLAKYLADRKKNVVLLLCDCTTPMLPCICPSGELEGDHSLGSAVFTLPHSPELEAQVLAGNLFTDLSLKDSRGFRKEIQKISEEVFGV